MTDHGESSLGDARRHRDYQELPGTLPEPPRHVGFPGSGVLAYLTSLPLQGTALHGHSPNACTLTEKVLCY